MTSAAAPLPDEGPTEAEQGRFTESPTGLLNDEDESDGEDEEDGSGEEEDGERRDEAQEEDEVSEDGSEDDDEDSDDDEPVLKYSRIEGSVPEVLKKDSASAVAVSGNRLLVSLYRVPWVPSP